MVPLANTAPGVVSRLVQLAPVARLQWSQRVQLFWSQKEGNQEGKKKASFRVLAQKGIN